MSEPKIGDVVVIAMRVTTVDAFGDICGRVVRANGDWRPYSFVRAHLADIRETNPTPRRV